MRAGSDIGYCDSEYRRNNTNNTYGNISESDVESTVESFGFIMHDANLCEEAIDLYLIDKETEIAYDYFDLSYEDYNRFKRKDYLEYYDQRYSACCQADVDSKSVCEYCKKVITL
tara:strand:- start:317 stop:661 length:345 start_codon:yes stop_codon:yes gene_type:complete